MSSGRESVPSSQGPSEGVISADAVVSSLGCVPSGSDEVPSFQRPTEGASTVGDVVGSSGSVPSVTGDVQSQAEGGVSGVLSFKSVLHISASGGAGGRDASPDELSGVRLMAGGDSLGDACGEGTLDDVEVRAVMGRDPLSDSEGASVPQALGMPLVVASPGPEEEGDGSVQEPSHSEGCESQVGVLGPTPSIDPGGRVMAVEEDSDAASGGGSECDVSDSSGLSEVVDSGASGLAESPDSKAVSEAKLIVEVREFLKISRAPKTLWWAVTRRWEDWLDVRESLEAILSNKDSGLSDSDLGQFWGLLKVLRKGPPVTTGSVRVTI